MKSSSVPNQTKDHKSKAIKYKINKIKEITSNKVQTKQRNRNYKH